MKPESVSVPFPMSKRLKFEEVDPVSQAKTNKQPPVPLPSPLIPPLDRWSSKEVLRQLRNRRRRRKRTNEQETAPKIFNLCLWEEEAEAEGGLWGGGWMMVVGKIISTEKLSQTTREGRKTMRSLRLRQIAKYP